jgi:DNA helicase-4
MICNWLYLHGINYEYERDYNVRTADEFHRQYAPDFYYPDIDAWHEHWALDLSGKPPKSFTGYLEQINWKRNLHKIHKTRLIETTFGEVVFSNGLLTLKETLMDLGIQIDWNPERPKAEFTEIEDTSLIRLVRAFMTHVKSNSLTQVDIEKRLLGDWAHLASERTKTFLELYWPIHEEWNKRLSNGNYIDFEDMLVQAAFEIEEGRYRPEYDLILVDEFQDSSVARGRLMKALLMATNKYALMVGDDWQSINRFAGADVSQMTKFHEEFGEGPTLVLSKTYRCSPTIADLSTSFVGKNPEQIKKVVEAERINPNLPVILVRTVDPQDGVHQILKRIESEKGSSTKASVFILGRYNFNEDWIPHDKYRNLDIKFSTVHSSKGLEADYVVIVNCESGRHGFPSEIEDDPVLNLAMSTPDKFEFAEERRLFYVAITRARKQVFMVSRINRESMFIAELLSENLLNVVTLDNSSTQKNSVQSCPKCKKGIMNLRSGKYGKFLGCSRFPKCDSTMNL